MKTVFKRLIQQNCHHKEVVTHSLSLLLIVEHCYGSLFIKQMYLIIINCYVVVVFTSNGFLVSVFKT